MCLDSTQVGEKGLQGRRGSIWGEWTVRGGLTWARLGSRDTAALSGWTWDFAASRFIRTSNGILKCSTGAVHHAAI
jgi:hypothetical protein